MLEKRAIVYLDTGATREHLLLVEDDDAYVKKYNEFVDVLNSGTYGLLVFGSPLCIYRVKNIIAIELLNPPVSDKLLMGFIAKKG